MSTIVHQPVAVSPFDAIRRVRSDGSEFWDARELMPLLGYTKWANFTEAIEQAQGVIAAEQGDEAARSQVAATGKITKNARGQSRSTPTFELSRHASYLTAMRGDARKPEVRSALTYFAVKTREAEVATTANQSLTPARMFMELAQQFMAQETRVAEIEQRQAALVQAQAETAAKLEAIEGQHDWFTALGFAKLHGLPTSRTYLMKVGKAATAIMRKDGQVPERRQDATFGTVNVYPSVVLEQAFAEVAA